MEGNQPHGIVSLIESFVLAKGNAFFVHYPYAIERPYDRDYRITWLHLHDYLLFLELSKTVLMVFCGDMSFCKGKLQARRAVVCMPPHYLHFLVPAEVLLESVGIISDNTLPNVQPPIPFEEFPLTSTVVQPVQGWFGRDAVGNYTIFLQDASSHQAYEHKAEGFVLSHTGSDYTMILFDKHICLWRGGKTTLDSQGESLIVSSFEHAVVLEWTECCFVAHTALSGSMRVSRLG
ncbi:hypothetical protein GXSOP10_1072 [Armatimonadetes bacterium GXS]|jgi:hypothetical protein|nr:hypothetical protein GXSOP10_1072 [Armatimonadetes bacterium GXS]